MSCECLPGKKAFNEYGVLFLNVPCPVTNTSEPYVQPLVE